MPPRSLDGQSPLGRLAHLFPPGRSAVALLFESNTIWLAIILAAKVEGVRHPTKAARIKVGNLFKKAARKSSPAEQVEENQTAEQGLSWLV